MSEMIERVARAIAAEIMELTADQRASFKFPDDCNGDTIDRARSCAIDVIEAMREPTEDMEEAGYNNEVSRDPSTTWGRMVAAALGNSVPKFWD